MSSLYLWWLFLSADYLFKFWANPLVGGADGSGHVAALHLYSKHVYPALDGWIPELFGGMPFPVYYPPLFYWSGATVMLLTGIDAALCAKLLTTLSFAALPGVLYLLGRRVGLKTFDALIAAAVAGVVACGSNIVSLSGIGLLGLFEVGLFTQTLGFVFFCLWAACLPRAGRSPLASLGALLFLVATILSNAHILPLVAFYAVTWLFTNLRRTIRRGVPLNASRVLLKTAYTLVLLVGSLLISGIWLVPLLKWYPYSVGQTLSSMGLFSSLGSLNVVWPVCAYVAWHERDRRRHLSSLCLALLIAAVVALTPLADRLKYIPFQPPRVIAGALFLCTIPVTQLVSRLLTEIFAGQRRTPYIILVVCTLALAWLHPMQRFGIGAFSQSEAEQINVVRAAVKQLSPGKVLVEIVEPKAIFNSPEARTRELALSRALTHEIARDRRPVVWSVFREQSLMAPYATAVSNLFSTTKETFGLSGIALQRSADESVSMTDRLKAASELNVSYFLVRTAKAFELLQKTPGVHLLWSINGWSLFTNGPNTSGDMQPIASLPVLAWLPAKSKNRSADEVDLFNLGEQLAFQGHPEVLPLWAHSEGVDTWDRIQRLQSAMVVVDPASVPSDQQEWIGALVREARKLRMILLDDGSRLAAQIHERQHDFATFTSISVNQLSSREVLATLVREVTKQAETANPDNGSVMIWRTSYGYFPAWQTSNGQSTFLTGQGGAAVLSVEAPYLTWHSRRVRLFALSICFVGLVISAGCLYTILFAVRGRMRPRA